VTAIEWTDLTWNPIVGCSKISEGCRNCYAIPQAYRNAAIAQKLENPGRLAYYEGLTEKRSGRTEWTGKINFVPDALNIPLQRKKPTKFFVNSMSDLWHESVTDEQIAEIWAVMQATPEHRYQVLTKRPQRMLHWITEYWGGIWRASRNKILPNVWVGVTVEDQKSADERIPLLLQVPASVRFLSCEPLLGEIDIDRAMYPNGGNSTFGFTDGFGEEAFLQWVIVGGESGHNARPCNIEWIRSIVRQCQAAHVPVFVKQLGSVPIIRKYTLEEYHAQKSPEFEFPEGTLFGNKTGDPLLNGLQVLLQDRKGGNITEFPEDLKIREFPVLCASHPR